MRIKFLLEVDGRTVGVFTLSSSDRSEYMDVYVASQKEGSFSIKEEDSFTFSYDSHDVAITAKMEER